MVYTEFTFVIAADVCIIIIYALVFCRMPEIKNVSMIECEKCLGWFHTSCETVDEEVLDKSDVKWICHSCNSLFCSHFLRRDV